MNTPPEVIRTNPLCATVRDGEYLDFFLDVYHPMVIDSRRLISSLTEHMETRFPFKEGYGLSTTKGLPCPYFEGRDALKFRIKASPEQVLMQATV